MVSVTGSRASGRHRVRAEASRTPVPAARFALWGTVAVVIIGFVVSIVGQVVASYRADPDRGQDALLIAAIGILLILIAVLVTVSTGAILQRVRISRVRRQTRDIVYVARTLPGFAESIRAFSGTWSSRDTIYCFSIGSSGIRLWTGLREPVMVAAIHWSAIDAVRLDRANSLTSSYWTVQVVASADSSAPLRLAPIEWLSGTLGKSRSTRVLHQLRWHLERRDSY